MSNITWSKADEQRLKELQDRKAAWELSRLNPVYDMIKKVHPGVEGVNRLESVGERMIKHADLIRDALAPFDSGVRKKKS